MEPLFENTCVWTRKTILELHRRVRRLFSIVLEAIVALEFVHFLILILRERLYMDFTLMAAAALFAILLAAVPFFPRISAAIAYKRYLNLFRQEQVSHTCFYEDRFTLGSMPSGGETTLEYAQIRRVMETKSLLLLRLTGKWIVMVDKSGFTRGDVATLKAFLQKKAVRNSGWSTPSAE